MAARVREKSNGRVRDRVRRERPRGERKEERATGLETKKPETKEETRSFGGWKNRKEKGFMG